MGLDMYANTMETKPERAVDFEVDLDNDEAIAYWRKHPNLHGWMERLYIDNGGEDGAFNLKPVLVTAKDLDDLEEDIHNGELPLTTGFFFGESQDHNPVDRKRTFDFIRKAREEIGKGKYVYYFAWW